MPSTANMNRNSASTSAAFSSVGSVSMRVVATRRSPLTKRTTLRREGRGAGEGNRGAVEGRPAQAAAHRRRCPTKRLPASPASLPAPGAAPQQLQHPDGAQRAHAACAAQEHGGHGGPGEQEVEPVPAAAEVGAGAMRRQLEYAFRAEQDGEGDARPVDGLRKRKGADERGGAGMEGCSDCCQAAARAQAQLPARGPGPRTSSQPGPWPQCCSDMMTPSAKTAAKMSRSNHRCCREVG